MSNFENFHATVSTSITFLQYFFFFSLSFFRFIDLDFSFCCCFSVTFSSFPFKLWNKKNCSDGWSYWALNAIGFIILLFFLSITWFKKIWILLRPINEDDPNLIELPTNPFLRYLFNASKSVMSNAVVRMLIYFVSVCALTVSALIHLVSKLSVFNCKAPLAMKQLFTRACFYYCPG